MAAPRLSHVARQPNAPSSTTAAARSVQRVPDRAARASYVLPNPRPLHPPPWWRHPRQGQVGMMTTKALPPVLTPWVPAPSPEPPSPVESMRSEAPAPINASATNQAVDATKGAVAEGGKSAKAVDGEKSACAEGGKQEKGVNMPGKKTNTAARRKASKSKNVQNGQKAKEAKEAKEANETMKAKEVMEKEAALMRKGVTYNDIYEGVPFTEDAYVAGLGASPPRATEAKDGLKEHDVHPAVDATDYAEQQSELSECGYDYGDQESEFEDPSPRHFAKADSTAAVHADVGSDGTPDISGSVQGNEQNAEHDGVHHAHSSPGFLSTPLLSGALLSPSSSEGNSLSPILNIRLHSDIVCTCNLINMPATTTEFLKFVGNLKDKSAKGHLGHATNHEPSQFSVMQLDELRKDMFIKRPEEDRIKWKEAEGEHYAIIDMKLWDPSVVHAQTDYVGLLRVKTGMPFSQVHVSEVLAESETHGAYARFKAVLTEQAICSLKSRKGDVSVVSWEKAGTEEALTPAEWV